MKKCTILLSEEVYKFYSLISETANIPIEKVLSDSLFNYAGELSAKEIQKHSKQ